MRPACAGTNPQAAGSRDSDTNGTGRCHSYGDGYCDREPKPTATPNARSGMTLSKGAPPL